MESISPTATMPEYSVASELSQLCLPREYKDPNRRLAWANSVCCLFLLIGLVGLRPPKTIVRPLSTPNEVIPVVLTPPEEQPKPTTEEKPPDPETTPEIAPDVPVVATVVAAD